MPIRLGTAAAEILELKLDGIPHSICRSDRISELIPVQMPHQVSSSGGQPRKLNTTRCWLCACLFVFFATSIVSASLHRSVFHVYTHTPGGLITGGRCQTSNAGYFPPSFPPFALLAFSMVSRYNNGSAFPSHILYALYVLATELFSRHKQTKPVTGQVNRNEPRAK